MNIKIFSQQECNYRQIQDTIAILPTAMDEVDPHAKPDISKALHFISTAVTGANPHLFFAVAEVNGITAGFISGALSHYTFEDRTFGQDILTYVKPEYQSSTVMQQMVKQFCDWCFDKGASEVRSMHTDKQNHFAWVSQQLGYTDLGKMVVCKRA